MNTNTFTIESIVYTNTTERAIHSGKYYQILLIDKGECEFEINGTYSYCNAETAVFLKPNQSTVLQYHASKYPLSVLSIRLIPDYLEVISDETCDLREKFSLVPVDKATIQLDTRNTTLMKSMTKTIRGLSRTENDFGYQLYEKSMLSILMILFLRSCMESDHAALTRNRKNLVMDDIFRYVREHLTEDLSLEVFEEQFYISRYHLCREFKKLTGQTLHAYILKTRLDLCKKYIEQGKPIKEVYALGGFGGYNHFFRAFKNEFGMTPKEYYESLTK